MKHYQLKYLWSTPKTVEQLNFVKLVLAILIIIKHHFPAASPPEKKKSIESVWSACCPCVNSLFTVINLTLSVYHQGVKAVYPVVFSPAVCRLVDLNKYHQTFQVPKTEESTPKQATWIRLLYTGRPTPKIAGLFLVPETFGNFWWRYFMASQPTPHLTTPPPQK